MTRSARVPRGEIEAANPWYVDDQFAVQLGTPAFRAVVENRWRRFERAIDEWVRARRGEPPSRLLDAGCGDGINLSFLAQTVVGRGWSTKLVGADYSALRINRALRVPGSLLIQGSMTSLGFQDQSFDVVLCNQVLEHIPDVAAAFLELHRMLRPGGLLIAGVPNEGSVLAGLRNRVLQRSILTSTDHVNMFTKRTLAAYLEKAHLTVERIEPEGFFVPHTVLHSWLNGHRGVKQSLDAIARAFPSCAAGLIAIATRSPSPSNVRD